MAAGRKALVVATYRYADGGLRQLTAPEHDAEAFAAVLEDPEIAGFDVTVLVNEPHHVVGEAIADFYGRCRRDDLTLLYFSGHGLKDDEGRLHLAMTNTRREALLFTALSAAQLNEAMDASASRRKVLILDCCYSGAFPAGRTAKADEGVQTLERFQGKGRAVLTASDATQYAFEGDALSGSASSSVFTRHLVEAIRTGAADLDEDGDIALDELYSYVREQVVAELPQQRPKKQEDVDGRIVIARNVHWTLPTHLRHAIESPIAAQRLGAVEGLAHLHRVGNDVVRATVAEHLESLAADDSRSVSAVATAELERIGRAGTPPTEAVPAQRRVPASETATVPAATPRRPAVASPAPVPAPPPTEPPEPPARPSAPALPRTVPFVLLPLTLLAGVLLTVARFLVFEPVNGYHAVDLSWSTAGWVVQVLLPLLAALGVLLARPRSPAATALAAGMVAGVLLNVVGQLWMSAMITLDPDVGYALGPAWWLLQVAAFVLGGAVAAAFTTPALRAGTGVRRRPAAAWGGALVVASAVGWLLVGPVSNDFGWFLHLRIAGLLLTAACLAVAVLELGPEQRTFGLAAVTTTGTWLAVVAVEFLAVQPDGWQAGPLLVSLGLALLPVGGAYLGQARPGPTDATS